MWSRLVWDGIVEKTFELKNSHNTRDIASWTSAAWRRLKLFQDSSTIADMYSSERRQDVVQIVR